MNDPIKTVAQALKKSVAGETVATVKYAAPRIVDLDGRVLPEWKNVNKPKTTKKNTSGPFVFDENDLEALRQAYNKNDVNALAELLPDNTTFVNRPEVPDTELMKNAKEYVDEKYGSEEERVNATADKKLFDLEQKLTEATEKADAAEREAAKEYDLGKENALDRTVRQVIVRSSVFDGMLERLQNTFDLEKRQIEQELARKTESVNVQIDFVERERTRALKEFDYEKAEAYDKKLAALRSAEYDARKEVLAYNQKITEWKKNLNEYRRKYAEQLLIEAAKKGKY